MRIIFETEVENALLVLVVDYEAEFFACCGQAWQA
jgi:hypothetical protein